MIIDDMLARLPWALPAAAPAVAVIRLAGAIGPAPSQLSLARLAGPIEAAFKTRNLAAVALAINSPGGSPVQSSLIHQRIRQLAAEKSVPVVAFVEDVAASGGYWLALSADEIFADPASIVGSIGVVSAGFGFPEALKRLGVERRLHATGERKAMLDPFSPEKPEDVARLLSLHAELKDLFVETVRARRGAKLKEDEAPLFEGDIWTGAKARSLGLIDGIGEIRGEMRRRFGDKVRLKAFGAPRSWLRRRLGLAGGALAGAVLAGIEERALWSRFGL